MSLTIEVLSCQFSDAAGIALADILKHNVTLQSLTITDLPDELLIVFAEALKRNQALVRQLYWKSFVYVVFFLERRPARPLEIKSDTTFFCSQRATFRILSRSLQVLYRLAYLDGRPLFSRFCELK